MWRNYQSFRDDRKKFDHTHFLHGNYSQGSTPFFMRLSHRETKGPELNEV